MKSFLSCFILLVLINTRQVKLANARNCPSSSDRVCITEYDPVKCGEDLHCVYYNQCFATAASSDFTAETCNEVCPTRFSSDIVCADVYDPVECGEDLQCVYSNQCEATAASSDFTAGTCNKVVCPKSSNRLSCIDVYDPVKCDECVYLNQCFATAVSSDFTAETCNKVLQTESTSGVAIAHSSLLYSLFLSFTLIAVVTAIG